MGVQIAFDFAAPTPPRQRSLHKARAGREDTTAAAAPPMLDGANHEAPEARHASALASDQPVVPVLDVSDAPGRRPGLGLRTASIAGSDDPSPRFSRHALEQAMRRRTGLPLSLLLTDNERTMISTRRQAGRFIVRVHHMFQHADAAVLEALSGYLTKADPNAGQVLGAFIESQRARIRKTRPRRIVVRAQGEHHDLEAILERLNRRYFDGRVDARITWARRTSAQTAARTTARSGAGEKRAKSRRSIKLGSYSSRDALIRIHPVLDQAWVPDFFVAFIVYHEMLHQVVPPRLHGSRREFHGPDFRARERRFEHYEQALAWEQRHLRQLLRA